MSAPRKIQIHDFEAQEYLQLLLQKVRENIRYALEWKHKYSHLAADGYSDYIGWARMDADKARYLAKRLKVHFGKESFEVRQARAQAFAAELEQRRAA